MMGVTRNMDLGDDDVFEDPSVACMNWIFEKLLNRVQPLIYTTRSIWKKENPVMASRLQYDMQHCCLCLENKLLQLGI